MRTPSRWCAVGLLALVLASSACVADLGPIMPDVQFAGTGALRSGRPLQVGVGPVRGPDDLHVSRAVASIIEDTGAFESERAATAAESDLYVEASYQRRCEPRHNRVLWPLAILTSTAVGALVTAVTSISGEYSHFSFGEFAYVSVALSVASVVSLFVSDVGADCIVELEAVVSRGGQPWRTYTEDGHVSVGSFTDVALLRVPVRRVAARLLRDLEGDRPGSFTDAALSPLPETRTCTGSACIAIAPAAGVTPGTGGGQ